MNYNEFIRKAAKDPDLLERLVETFDETAKELELDKEATTRLKLLSDTIDRIRLNTPHEIARMSSVLSRGLGRGLAAWKDQYEDKYADKYTDKYTDDGPEELAEIFGLERRSIFQSVPQQVR